MIKLQVFILYFFLCYQTVFSVIMQVSESVQKPSLRTKFNGPQQQVYKNFKYLQNIQMIQLSNANPENQFELKENQFAYLSVQEFSKLHLNLFPSTPGTVIFSKVISTLPNPLRYSLVVDPDPQQQKREREIIKEKENIYRNVIQNVTEEKQNQIARQNKNSSQQPTTSNKIYPKSNESNITDQKVSLRTENQSRFDNPFSYPDSLQKALSFLNKFKVANPVNNQVNQITKKPVKKVKTGKTTQLQKSFIKNPLNLDQINSPSSKSKQDGKLSLQFTSSTSSNFPVLLAPFSTSSALQTPKPNPQKILKGSIWSTSLLEESSLNSRRLMFSSDSVLDSLERQILMNVSKILKERKIQQKIGVNQLIQKYRYKGDLSTYDFVMQKLEQQNKKNRRLLQSIQKQNQNSRPQTSSNKQNNTNSTSNTNTNTNNSSNYNNKESSTKSSDTTTNSSSIDKNSSENKSSATTVISISNANANNTANTTTQIVPQKPETVIQDVDWTCMSGFIRRQGYCGACYAFAAVDVVATTLAIYQFRYHIPLSAQDLIDCAANSLTFGCEGGYLQGSYAYIKQIGILNTYSYPYESENGPRKLKVKCTTLTKVGPRYSIASFIKIQQENSCKQLLTVLQRHPVSVAITGYTLAFYDKGLFRCPVRDTELNHAVVVIGYKKGVGWKLKNSWGSAWGREGYFWLKEGNTCRICQLGFYAIPGEGFGYDNYEKGRKLVTCEPPTYP